ncbi:hypothetical protein PINS_up002295 [Pythium insidiosum]|nr:hypothetical protein PINS_up002295 [Pythium insidiosum]
MGTRDAGARGVSAEKLEVAALRDPARLAQWLVEASHGPSEGRRALAKSHLVHDTAHDDDDDEDGEDVDEEEAAADAMAQDADASSLADDKRLACVEDHLSALATAMQLASDVVDRLKLRMALAAGDQMRIQMHGEKSSDQRRHGGVRDTHRLRVVTTPGEPVPNARVAADAAACAKCQRSFSTFSRSKNCT